MSDLFPRASVAAGRAGRRHGKPSRHALGTAAGLRARLVPICVLPPVVVLLAGAVAASLIPVGSGVAVVLVAAGTAGVMGVGVSGWWAAITARAIGEQHAEAEGQALTRLLDQAGRDRRQLEEYAHHIRRGHRLDPPGPLLPALGPSLFDQAEHAVRGLTHAAHTCLAADSNRQRIDVLVNLARRLQTLANRSLKVLDAVENDIEDPGLLKRVFEVDHILTQMRRQVDNQAVVGGAVPRRINEPMPLDALLRHAVQEIARYPRVRIVYPVPGVVHGRAAADLIHLVAELADNATQFSPPETVVQITAQLVPAGLVVEIDDRGLPMPPDVLNRLNSLFTEPDRFGVDEQVRDGRIGALVVARLARRHGITVQLGANFYGGNQARVLLPTDLLTTLSPADPPSPSPVPSGHFAVGVSRIPAPAASHGDNAPLYRTPLEPAQPHPLPRRTHTPQAAAPADVPAGDRTERPPLPQRNRTAGPLAPQGRQPSVPGPAEDGPPSPGLMAAFTRGQARATNPDSLPGTSGPANQPPSKEYLP